MYQPAHRHAPNAAFLLPALFAASTSEMAAHFAKQFVDWLMSPPAVISSSGANEMQRAS